LAPPEPDLPDHTLNIAPPDPSVSPDALPALPALLAELHQQGLIGAAMDAQQFPHSYHIGDAYPRLLSFMGCSPSFKTEPEHPDDRDFCRLEILGPWSEPRLLGRLQDAAPRCPACGKVDRQWQQQATDPEACLPWESWRCPQCCHVADWGQLDWRQRAGFTRLALVFHHVFEGEVVPTPELLATLSRHCGGDWRWFYA
jgi:hypothetical protein